MFTGDLVTKFHFISGTNICVQRWQHWSFLGACRWKLISIGSQFNPAFLWKEIETLRYPFHEKRMLLFSGCRIVIQIVKRCKHRNVMKSQKRVARTGSSNHCMCSSSISLYLANFNSKYSFIRQIGNTDIGAIPVSCSAFENTDLRPQTLQEEIQFFSLKEEK